MHVGSGETCDSAKGKNTKRRRANERSRAVCRGWVRRDASFRHAVSRVCVCARLALAGVRVQWSLSGRGDAEPAETAKPTRYVQPSCSPTLPVSRSPPSISIHPSLSLSLFVALRFVDTHGHKRTYRERTHVDRGERIRTVTLSFAPWGRPLSNRKPQRATALIKRAIDRHYR